MIDIINNPGPVSLLDEDLLQFFGKVVGFGLRSGIPLCLDLVPSFWKSLLDKSVDGDDLSAFDPIVSSYLSKIVSISTQDEFDDFVEDTHFPRFTYPSIRGDDCELLSGGSDTYLSWENRLVDLRTYFFATTSNHILKKLPQTKLCRTSPTIPAR